MIKFDTREAWLMAAADALRPHFMTEAGAFIPSVRISCGFPANASVQKVIGQCINPTFTEDEQPQIYINPILVNPIEVLRCLSHELIHAVNFSAGHGPKFQKIFKAVGHDGSALCTEATMEYEAQLSQLAEELGEYPHAGIKLTEYKTPTGRVKQRITGAPKVQTTRMLKIVCAGCGMITRTSNLWLEKLLDLHDEGASQTGPCMLCGHDTHAE